MCHFDVCVKEQSPVGDVNICVSVPHKAQEGAANRWFALKNSAWRKKSACLLIIVTLYTWL